MMRWMCPKHRAQLLVLSYRCPAGQRPPGPLHCASARPTDHHTSLSLYVHLRAEGGVCSEVPKRAATTDPHTNHR